MKSWTYTAEYIAGRTITTACPDGSLQCLTEEIEMEDSIDFLSMPKNLAIPEIKHIARAPKPRSVAVTAGMGAR